MEALLKSLSESAVITELERYEFLKMAKQSDQSPIEVILSNINVNPYFLYKKIAKHEGLEFVDLRECPCDKELL